jgi:hypothetical protein
MRPLSAGLANMLHNAVTPNHSQVRIVAEKRIRQPERLCKRLLREDVVNTDAKILDVQFLELVVVDLPGRQILRSRRL